MYARIGGREFHCTINGYARTRVFELPGINFLPEGAKPFHEIYDASPIRACLVSGLSDYFENSTQNQHYSISPALQHDVGEIEEKNKQSQESRAPVYLVVEESNQLAPVTMVNGECWIADEVIVLNSERIQIATGGREGGQFITAWATGDGAWPELPNNELWVNLVLAAVRLGQDTAGPIRKHLDRNGLVTDDGRFVGMSRPTVSARLSVTKPMDATGYDKRAQEIRRIVTAMAQDINTPHLALLVNSMYSDERKDDSYQRLQYLGLWESLVGAARKLLGYSGRGIRCDKKVVAGTKTLEELKNYRNDVAHWWTDTIDENFLANLQLTVNEMLRRKYPPK